MIPRHAERGGEIAEMLASKGIAYIRKSTLAADSAVDDSVQCLLADTTGEMLKFMNVSDIVIMGKSLAGQDEGHNLIEPALLKRTIISGPVLKNFRFLLDLLKNANGVAIATDETLVEVAAEILADKEYSDTIRMNAYNAVHANAGATERTINAMTEIA